MIKISTQNGQVLSDEELALIELQNKIQKAKEYLLSTDYKMTVDYYATLSQEAQTEITTKRAEAREFIRSNDVSNS